MHHFQKRIFRLVNTAFQKFPGLKKQTSRVFQNQKKLFIDRMANFSAQGSVYPYNQLTKSVNIGYTANVVIV